MAKHAGGCLCGAVRFALNDDPEGTYGWHCRFCQKAIGTAFCSALRFKKRDVTFNGANIKTYVYKSPDHGRSRDVHFCPNCATTVTLTTERSPDFQVMMLGILDDPSKIEVTTHMFVDEGMPWVAFHDVDIVYARHRINEDGTQATPLQRGTLNLMYRLISSAYRRTFALIYTIRRFRLLNVVRLQSRLPDNPFG